jgi:hypothetical protein
MFNIANARSEMGENMNMAVGIWELIFNNVG